MVLKCESCGAQNPATNRFCGQCGRKLEQTAIAPEEFWRESRTENQAGQVEASANLPPEVIDFDNQIPLIAAEGTDRRRYPSPELAEVAHEHLEREAELHDHLRHGGETHFDVLAKKIKKAEEERASRMEILRWKEAELESRGVFMPWNLDNEAGVKDPAGSRESVVIDDGKAAHAIMDAAAEPGTVPLGQPSDRRNIGAEEKRDDKLDQKSEEKKPVPAGLSSLSILGLNDDHVEYADEEPEAEESHLGRNLVLAAVAVTVILLGWQWRSIRDYGMASVRNGSAYLEHGWTAAQTFAQDGWTYAENGLADAQDGLTSAWNSWQQPKPSEQPIASAPPADPVGSSVQKPAPLRQSLSGAPRAAGSSPRAMYKLPARQTASSSKPRRDTFSAARRRPAAMSASASVPEESPAARRAAEASGRSGTDSTPGTDEMNRAARAVDPELRAVWLWRALAKGNPEAPVELATMYEQGDGVTRSCDQARVLLRSAAAKGNEQAKESLWQLQFRGGCSAR